MPTKKISELDATNAISPTSVFPIVVEGVTKKASLETISSNIVESAKNEINQLNFIKSETDSFSGATQITNIVSISQAEYDSIQEKNPSTLYIVRPF